MPAKAVVLPAFIIQSQRFHGYVDMEKKKKINLYGHS